MTIPQSIFSAMLFTGLAASVFSAGMQTVSSAISEITVYQDRAHVTRVGSITLPQDETVLEFGGLPASLDEGSVEVSAKSSAHVTIQGVDVREEFLTENANPQAELFRRQLQQLEDQKRSLASKKATAEISIRYTIGGASWNSTYDARLDSNSGKGAFSDKPSSIDKDSGEITWEVESKPKEKKVIELGYSVEWPKGKEIVGG